MFYLYFRSNIFVEASSKNGWIRIIVEQPFESFSGLTRCLKKYLVVLPFSNLIFDPLWSQNYICNVQLIFCKDFGTKVREDYFDNYGTIWTKNVDYLSSFTDDEWSEDAIIFSHVGGEVLYLPKDVTMPITMKFQEYEVFIEVSVKELTNGVKVAHTGLIKMFNPGDAAFKQWEPGGFFSLVCCEGTHDLEGTGINTTITQ